MKRPVECASHFADPSVLGSGVEFDRANAARMHNFAVDREQVTRLSAAHPDIEAAARANRAFFGRVVRRCVAVGIDQFLDLGSGAPTMGNVHEIALGLAPVARAAYVDVDVEPIALEHAHAVVADLDKVIVTRADLRDSRMLLASPAVGLDLEPPGFVDVIDWPEPRPGPTLDTAVYGALAHVPL